jgi:putative peptidoglycan lipid II flippase
VPISGGPTTPRPSASARRQPRRWIPIVIALALLLIAAGVTTGVALNKGSGTASGGPTGSGSTSASASAGVRVPIVAGRDFDPQGDDKTENPQLVRYAFDGNPATRWRTLTYFGNPKLGGIKRGVGLVLDLGSAQNVRSVTVSLSGDGTDLELRVPKADPAQITAPPMTSDSLWRSVATQPKAGRTATLVASGPVSTRFLLIYLTSLPKEGNGYRGGVYEVEVNS